ncbi:MAG: hypothetical protein Kow0026_20740 [Oricola sp.]
MSLACADIPDRIRALVAREIADYDSVTEGRGPEGRQCPPYFVDWRRRSLAHFRESLCDPRAIEVNFAGGAVQTCWSVTRSNGAYRVIFLPRAGYFSLCVESRYGPVDIGVHGNAIECFDSV